MKALNMHALIFALAALALAGCAGDRTLEMTAHEQNAEAIATAAVETKDLPAPEAAAAEPGDLLAKARAIAASKGLGGGGGEDEARARAALAPIAGGAQAGGGAQATATGAASDAQAIFQRAAMRFAAQGGSDNMSNARSDNTSPVSNAQRMDANDPREIFRKAQALARDRALAESRAFGSLAPTPAPASNAQTYFVEAMRLRQQQSALALGALAQ